MVIIIYLRFVIRIRNLQAIHVHRMWQCSITSEFHIWSAADDTSQWFRLHYLRNADGIWAKRRPLIQYTYTGYIVYSIYHHSDRLISQITSLLTEMRSLCERSASFSFTVKRVKKIKRYKWWTATWSTSLEHAIPFIVSMNSIIQRPHPTCAIDAEQHSKLFSWFCIQHN